VLERIKGYRSYKLDLADPRSHEPLVDANAAGLAGESYYATTDNPPYYKRAPGAVANLRLRQGVADRLTRANERLAPAGIEVFVFDAWRPRAVQAYFHDVWMPGELLARNPNLSPDEVTRATESYWARPTADASSPAPHATGGAVDLTLRWKRTGQHLWMGSLFDDASEIAHTDHFESHGPAAGKLEFSNDEARANRRLLHWILVEQNFAPNPTEWWHFGYGELMWAKLTGAPHAFYGAIEA
jgi:D-alanyl-D-alanine dipeptidase